MRDRALLDKGWKFRLADPKPLSLGGAWGNDGQCRDEAAGIRYDDADWRVVDLPHDFVVERPFVPDTAFPELGRSVSSKLTGYRPGGVGWYRKRLHVAEEDRSKRVYLHFDGVYRDSKVYLNEFFIGHHLSGYTSFYFDVTEFVDFGGENLLAVRADATHNEGWWYEGGGIYRHVWLEKVSPVHVAPWGTFVRSEVHLAGARADAGLAISTRVNSRKHFECECEVRSEILDPSGQAVGQAESWLALPAWGEAELMQQVGVEGAQLWSLEEPQLYTLVTSVTVDGSITDRYETTFGMRSIRFDPETGFHLNEQPVKIKGVCCHQDHAGVGIAVPDSLHRFRLERLKEMGCNAYRSSHHPATPSLLDLCDRIGMLVIDENRVLSSSSENVAQLESMILRDRNHPSVILWSLGNEEVSIQWKPQSRMITRTLRSLARSLDPTRPVTLAICYWNPVTDADEPLSNTPLPAAELDVMGFNYAHQHWEAYHAMRPDQPLIVSEATSGMRTRGQYLSEPARRHTTWEDVSDSHVQEEHWAKVAEHEFLSGIFIWTGFDYRGEPTPHDWPAISSHFGVMDTCGFPKDNYFYYRAWWRPEPMVYLAPHWNWPDSLGQPMTVYCYSNCDEVELFVNGNSYGRKVVEKHRHLEWPDVVYEPGAVEAEGYRAGELVATARVETTGGPHLVSLTPDRDCIADDGRDVAAVTVAIVDRDSRVVPSADNEVVFAIEGEGRIIGVGNGNPSSLEPDQGSMRRAFHGLCQVLVQTTGRPGTIVLTGRSPGLRAGRCTIEVHSDGLAVQPAREELSALRQRTAEE